MTGRSTARWGRALRLAVFVSPHGFGHAARTCAVLAALRELRPELEVTLYTTAPHWFFTESLGFDFGYRELACDVGMAQKSALEEDLAETVWRLESFRTETNGFHPGGLVSEVRDSGAVAVLCDISPLGLAVARDAGLPGILVENFTWDWIYEPLVEREPRFAPWVERMRDLFALADLRIRCEPVCGGTLVGGDERAEPKVGTSESGEPHAPLSVGDWPSPGELERRATAVDVAPVARRAGSTPGEVRVRLGLAPPDSGRALVLVSMGGIEWTFGSLERLAAAREHDFVVPGGAEREQRRGNLVLLPHRSPVHHPDLVAAADVVVGKLGYSTVAEAVRAGGRYLFPPRPWFREHPVLADYVRARLPSAEVSLGELESGAWVERLPSLLAEPRAAPDRRDGAAQAAREIVARFGG